MPRCFEAKQPQSLSGMGMEQNNPTLRKRQPRMDTEVAEEKFREIPRDSAADFLSIRKTSEAFDPETHAVISAAIQVHRELGPGYLEAVYQEALSIELEKRGIPFEREFLLPIVYGDRILATKYRCDFVCFGTTVVELKSQPTTGAPEQAQVLNYLKASGCPKALLINFGTQRLGLKRFVFDPAQHRSAEAAG